LVSVEVAEGAGTKKLFQMALRRWRCRVCGLMTRSYLGEARVSEIHKVCEHDDWESLSRNVYSHTITHPSPKPLALMRWLVRLATLPSGLVLDCFAGSGATAEAAVLERRRCITIERDSAYLELVRVRLRRQHCFRSGVSADV
jgi:rubredoxin